MSITMIAMSVFCISCRDQNCAAHNDKHRKLKGTPNDSTVFRSRYVYFDF